MPPFAFGTFPQQVGGQQENEPPLGSQVKRFLHALRLVEMTNQNTQGSCFLPPKRADCSARFLFISFILIHSIASISHAFVHVSKCIFSEYIHFILFLPTRKELKKVKIFIRFYTKISQNRQKATSLFE